MTDTDTDAGAGAGTDAENLQLVLRDVIAAAVPRPRWSPKGVVRSQIGDGSASDRIGRNCHGPLCVVSCVVRKRRRREEEKSEKIRDESSVYCLFTWQTQTVSSVRPLNWELNYISLLAGRSDAACKQTEYMKERKKQLPQ